MSRCKGKNCKYTHGFDIPHSPECEETRDSAYGPNNVNVLNPEHDIAQLGSKEYMSLLVLTLQVLGLNEIVLSTQEIEESCGTDVVLCIGGMKEGIHLSLVSREEADEIAKEQRGGDH